MVNPFDPRDFVRETLAWKPAQPLSGYFPIGMAEHVMSINGKPVEPEDMDRTYLDKTDCLVICPIPTGGGGSKNILRIVAMIAIATFAPYAATAMYGAMGGTFVMAGAGMAISAMTIGITLAGGLLVNALLPPPKTDKASASVGDGSSYGIDGAKNTAAEGIPVPVCYGSFRMGGNVLSSFVENQGKTQSLYLLLNAGEGPVASLGDLRINDQPLDSFKKVESLVRLGTAEQAMIPWFADSITPVSLNRQLTPNEYVTYQTQGEVDKLRFDIVFPQGMGTTNLDSGKRSAVTVDLEIDVRRRLGDGTFSPWVPVGEHQNGFTPLFHYTLTQDPVPQYVGGRIVGWTEGASTQVTSDTLPEGYGWGGANAENLFSRAYPQAAALLLKLSPDEFGGTGPDVVTRKVTTSVYSGTQEGQDTYTQVVSDVVVGTFDRIPVMLPGIKVTENSTVAVRRSYTSPTLEEGLYEARIRRTTPDTDETHIQDDVAITDINEIITEDVSYSHTALVAVKIQLDEQLSGMPTVTFLNTGRTVRAFNFAANAWETNKSSNNPAWIVLDALTHTRYGASMPLSRFDIEMFKEWARYCEQAGLTFDGVIDTASNVWDAMQPVLRCGHAQIVNVGTRYTVVIERAAAPTMMFGVGNIIEGSFKETWLGVADRANEIEVTYYDKSDFYKQKSIRVVDETAAARGEKQRPSSISLVGVVDRERAYKEGFFQLNLNRYILQSVEFSAPIEAIACTVGDLVYVQHDMPQWGFAGRTEAGSSASVIRLDREVPAEAGKQYKLLLTHSAIRRATGSIASVVGNSVFLSTVPNTPVKRIKSGGIDRAVLSTFAGGVVVDGVGNEFSAGAAYELWDTDVIEERDVVIAGSGDYQTLTVMSPFSVSPDQFVNWMFGEVNKVRKPFRVKAVSGTHDYKRELTCIEYNASCYDFSTMVVPTPNYSSLESSVEHVTLDGVKESVVVTGAGVMTEVTVGFYSTQESYASSTVKASVNGRAFEVIATEAPHSASMYAQPGDIIIFKVIAQDVLGAVASEGTAPTVSHIVTGSSVSAPTLAGLSLSIDSTGVTASWDTPTVTPLQEWGFTEVRVGESWATGAVAFTGKTASVNLGWRPDGMLSVWAAHGNNSGIWASPQRAQLEILPPLQPIVTAEVWRNEVTLKWQDCAASQPISGYDVRVGPTFATSIQFDMVNALSCIRSETRAGNYTYWVVARDTGGNDSPPGYIQVSLLPSIDEALEELTAGLDDTIRDMTIDLTLLKVKDAFDASIAAVATSAEVVGRVQAVTEEATIRAAEITAEATARAESITAEALVRAEGFVAEGQARTAAIAEETAARAAALIAEALARGTAISQEQTLRQTGDDQIAATVTTLTATVTSGNTTTAAAIQSEATARATADAAEAALRETLAVQVSNNATAANAALTNEASVRATADTAEAAARSALAATVATNLTTATSLIADEALARAAADSAEATTRNALAVQLRGNDTGTSIGALTSGLLYEERTARVTADAAEVSERTSLAAQFRGAYTGTDIGAVTSGLLYQERIARANADQGLAQQITLLSAGQGEQFDYKAIWYFDAGVEGWTGNGAPTAANGWLRPLDHATDPHVQTPTGLGVAASQYNQVKLRIRKTGSPVWEGKLYWLAPGETTWDAARSISLSEPTYDANNIGLVTATPDWAGTIDRIRLDLTAAQSPANCMEMDWAAIGRPSPGASSAALLEEGTARASADSAEVTKREALSAAIVGQADPTGKTLANLTQGLIFDERVLRVAQDSALATSISTLTATVNGNNTTQNAAVTVEATARANADTALSTTLTALTATVTGNNTTQTSAITTEQSARATADGALTTRIDALVSTTNTDRTNAAALVGSETTARTTADTAISNTVTALTATVTANKSTAAAATTSEETARVNADGALGVRIDTVVAQATTDKGAAAAAITAEQAARANADTALSTTITNLTATVSTNKTAAAALVSTEQTARVTADSALTTRVDNLVSQTNADRNAAAAAVATEATARTTADTANASLITLVQSQVNSAGSSVNRLTNPTLNMSAGGLPSNWGVYNNSGTAQPTALSVVAGTDGYNAIRVTWIGSNTSTKGVYQNPIKTLMKANAWYIYAFKVRAVTSASGTSTAGLRVTASGTNAPAIATYTVLKDPVLTTEWQWYVAKVRRTAGDSSNFYISIIGAGDVGENAYDICQPIIHEGEVFGGFNEGPLEAAIQSEASTRITETGKLFAKWGVTLSVDGKITGVQMNNDGASSNFVILTDRFAVATDSSGTTKYPFTIGTINGVSSVGISGNMYVDGTINGKALVVNSVTADRIDTRGLSIKNAAGTVILSSGSTLQAQIAPYTSGATVGATFGTNIYGKINSANVSTYIADLAVNTLQIAGNAVTATYSGTLASTTSVLTNSYAAYAFRPTGNYVYSIIESSVFNNVGQGLLVMANGGVMLANFSTKPIAAMHVYVAPTDSAGVVISPATLYPVATVAVIWDAGTGLSSGQYSIQVAVVPPAGYFKVVLAFSQWVGDSTSSRIYFQGINGEGTVFNPSTTLTVMGTKK